MIKPSYHELDKTKITPFPFQVVYICGSKVIESIQQFFLTFFFGFQNLCETEHWLRERRFVIDFWPVNNLTSLLKVTPSKNKLVCSNDTFRLRFNAKKDESGLKRFVKKFYVKY